MAKKKNAPVIKNNLRNEPAEKFRTVNRMNGIVTMVEYSSEDDIKAYELEPTYRELGGGGGGSSLFSTAKVTIINNKSEDILLKLPVYHIGEEIGMIIQGDAPIDASETYIYDAIIPASNGKTILTKEPQISENSIEITGNAEYLGGVVMITGDCTITFKA